ncbi:MAG: PmoA family protein [Planctomycetes bacterium]|nr:PmoA family protein [Planctomycetota bacterium]
MKTILFFGLLIFITTPLSAQFSIEEIKNDHIAIKYDGQYLARLETKNDKANDEKALETYKVYMSISNPFNPGKNITKQAGHKFPHHRGIYIGWKKTIIANDGNYDTWHMKRGVRQEFSEIISQESSKENAKLTVTINWVSSSDLILKEERSFVFYKPNANKSFTLDKTSKIFAIKDDTKLMGDPEHAGCQFRANEEVVNNKSAKYLFAEGALNEKEVKKKSGLEWACINFETQGQKFIVQHMTHPSLKDNLIYSAYRNYGRFGSYMVKDIKKGESEEFKFRFYISPGQFNESTVNECKERYAEFLKNI